MGDQDLHDYDDDYIFADYNAVDNPNSYETVRKRDVAGLTIKQCVTWHGGAGYWYLVRGLGDRAILVLVRPCHVRHAFKDSEQVAALAARVAAKKGWKKIVAEPSLTDRQVYVCMGYSEWMTCYSSYGAMGTYLCSVC